MLLRCAFVWDSGSTSTPTCTRTRIGWHLNLKHPARAGQFRVFMRHLHVHTFCWSHLESLIHTQDCSGASSRPRL